MNNNIREKNNGKFPLQHGIGFKENKKNGLNNHDKNELPVLVIGGAGFIGSNLSHRLLSSGKEVIVFDNLSRPGVEENLKWLKKNHGDLLNIKIGDIRNSYLLRKIIRNAGSIFHFAAQVAVTTSLDDPLYDFEVNVRGAINILEAIRSLVDKPPLIFTSTNKVYGGLDDIKLQENGCRYLPINNTVREKGINEERHLDFHSPYGCSKGAADQYIIDYARSFNLPTVVFRMSCIYGPHQFGTEDQGWVAHFLIQTLKKNKITVYGNGKQVRDILFVQDLVDAFLLARNNIERIKGEAFNIGGGPENTISLLELIDIIKSLKTYKPEIEFNDWRIGDQKYYVSDFTKFKNATGWSPKINPRQGISLLAGWLEEFLFEKKQEMKKETLMELNRKKKELA
jgi:CDP-paratose 2-epimerase